MPGRHPIRLIPCLFLFATCCSVFLIGKQVVTEFSSSKGSDPGNEPPRVHFLSSNNEKEPIINRRDPEQHNVTKMGDALPGYFYEDLFRPFRQDPGLHNVTTTGQGMPGFFDEDRLFLIGTRISCNHYDKDVHIVLFGLPGDWLLRGLPLYNPERPACEKNVNTVKRKNKVFTFAESAKQVRLFCRIGNHSREPMNLIPLKSGDMNDQSNTLIWRCNVTKYLDREALAKAATEDVDRALRVSFEISGQSNVSSTKPLVEVDFPLATGLVGYGGPQIRGRNYSASYFTQPKINVGLCVNTYGKKSQKYLSEFVQHHMNVGFQQITIGVKATLGSEELLTVQRLLAPYIDSGFVVLLATDLGPYFECTPVLRQLNFFQPCLYHFKGISKYCGFWDLDEYYLPPTGPLEISGMRDFHHAHIGHDDGDKEGKNKKVEWIQPKDSKINGEYLKKSDPSRFFHEVTKDPHWKASRYAESPSVQDVMSTIERYRINHGCDAASWCWHMFPSYTVHLLPHLSGDGSVNRTHRQSQDFHKRDRKVNYRWHKSIVNTQVAMMAGQHFAGSCLANGKYAKFARIQECLPHRFAPEIFGSLHHMLSLMEDRSDTRNKNKDQLPEDEYARGYGETVAKQLDTWYSRATGTAWGPSS